VTDTPIRTTFEAKSHDDVERLLASAFGATCWVCRRSPWPRGLTFKNLTICAECAPLAKQREVMNDVDDQERAALRVGFDRAGAYLESIQKFDLTELSEAEADTFLAHLLCGFSEAMRESTAASPPF
jgi:hypothetical protein